MRLFPLLSGLGLTALAAACSDDAVTPSGTAGASPTAGTSATAGTATTAGAGGNATSGAGGNGTAGTGANATSGAGGSTGGTGSAGAAPHHDGGAAGDGTDGVGGQAPAGNGCIVPLYSYPNATAWSDIVKAKQAHHNVEVVAIVNPDNGPGAQVDATFTSGIAQLVAASIVPIGYVSTNYTQRGESTVNADTDKWHALYPAVQGIFFDEQSIENGDEAFYSAVAAHARQQGLPLSVGNPGTGVPNSFIGTVDVMLAYESAGTPTLNSLQKYAANREHFGIIPYATALDASFVQAAAHSVRYVYLTDDDLPNPWDSLPSYFDDLLAALAQ
jgi:hypothetical protein